MLSKYLKESQLREEENTELKVGDHVKNLYGRSGIITKIENDVCEVEYPETAALMARTDRHYTSELKLEEALTFNTFVGPEATEPKFKVGDKVKAGEHCGTVSQVVPMKLSATPTYKIKLDDGKEIDRYEEEISLCESMEEEDVFTGKAKPAGDNEEHYIVEVDGIPGAFDIWATDQEELCSQISSGDWIDEALDQLEFCVTSVSVESEGNLEEDGSIEFKMIVEYDLDEEDDDYEEDELSPAEEAAQAWTDDPYEQRDFIKGYEDAVNKKKPCKNWSDEPREQELYNDGYKQGKQSLNKSIKEFLYKEEAKTYKIEMEVKSNNLKAMALEDMIEKEINKIDGIVVNYVEAEQI